MNTHLIASNTHHDVVSTQTMVSDIHRNMLESQEGTNDQVRLVSYISTPFHHQMNNQSLLDSTQVSSLDYQWVQWLILTSSAPGELPPPPPRACFGRDELIEKIVSLAENLAPFALIGAGGIGKTSIALTALHNNCLKQHFGNNRRFIRCDQFPTSLTHFLCRLSKVIGAGVDNPEDLTSLRPSLSSEEMFIVLDNAESILDPQGMDAQEIYAVVEELGQFSNIGLCITSRVSTIPPDCETLEIPTLSVEAAHNAFYHIYKKGKRANLVNKILKQLDFHPLSITLLATVAHHNRWDMDRLTKEWEKQRTDVLCTHHNKSLATTIKLSLASPMFQELSPEAQELLGVIAFFPQGINENNVEWLFSTIPDATSMFNRFCILSLTYRSNGFVMMLAPLRDYLCPKDPTLSTLLCMTKECYFGRLSVGVYPGKPGYQEAQWIKSEDVNIEHLIDVFTTIDMDSNGIWDVCSYFMQHLAYHKPRLVLLGPKIEALLDNHPSKPQCLFMLSWTFNSVGNDTERKRLLIHTLQLWRARGDDLGVVWALCSLSYVNQQLGLCKEGIQQANEALEISERLGDIFTQACSLHSLAWSLYQDQQLDTAEEVALKSISLLQEKGDQHLVCMCHYLLGKIHSSKGGTEEAVNHFEAALSVMTSSNWQYGLFWIHHSLAWLFSNQDRFNDAQAHIEHARSHTVNDTYLTGEAMYLQAWCWYCQGKLGNARLEVLHATDVYEKLGAARNLEACRDLLHDIEEEMATSDESNINGECLISCVLSSGKLFSTHINLPFQTQGTE